MPSWRGVNPFIYSPVGSTCVAGSNHKGQDDSLEAVEEASRRGPETLAGGAGRRHGPTWRPLAPGFFRCLLESSHIPFVIFFVADKFCGKYAIESLFSAFLEIDPGKYRICKTRGNYQFKT